VDIYISLLVPLFFYSVLYIQTKVYDSSVVHASKDGNSNGNGNGDNSQKLLMTAVPIEQWISHVSTSKARTTESARLRLHDALMSFNYMISEEALQTVSMVRDYFYLIFYFYFFWHDMIV
jgi:hypothetical protein